MPSCSELQADLAALKALGAEFDRALSAAAKAPDQESARQAITKAKALKQTIERSIAALREQLSPRLERELNLREQYDKQRALWEGLGLSRLEAINGQHYNLPEYTDVLALFEKHKEVVKRKASHGFTKLLLVPFGLSNDRLTSLLSQRLLEHHRQGKLLRTKKTPADPDQPFPLKLEPDEQVYFGASAVRTGDVTGDLLYYPTDFSQKNGQTKQELLASQGGWQIMLVEDRPCLPAQGEAAGLAKGGRSPMEAGFDSNHYLKETRTNPAYQNEHGFTYESWVAYLLTYLAETSQVIDDWQGQGKISRLFGCQIKSSGYVPTAGAELDYSLLCVGSAGAGSPDDRVAGRSAVVVM